MHCTSVRLYGKNAKMARFKSDCNDLSMEYERQIAELTSDLRQARAKNAVTVSTPARPQNVPIPAKRTRYASIVAFNSSDEEAKGLLSEEDGWIKVAKKVSKVVRDRVNISETGALRNKIMLKSGQVILESNSKAQNDAVRTALAGAPGIKVKELTNQDPTVVLTGVEKGYNENEFLHEVFSQNERIREYIGTEDVWNKSIRYLTRKECRNKEKENWTLKSVSTTLCFSRKGGQGCVRPG